MKKITKNPKISVVIPVYNEEKRLVGNLDKIINFFKSHKLTSELIIVNDGSTDKTGEILKSYKKRHPHIFLLQHPENKGKGAAVKTGMLASSGELVLMTDCDLSTPITEFDTLLPYTEKFDIVIGSRRLREKKLGKMPERYRTLMGDIYYEMLRLVLLPSVKDTNCGFKLFSKKVIKPVFSRQKTNRWGYDAEVLFIAHKHRYSIKEVPVKWSHFGGSKVKIFEAAAKTLKELVQIKINDWKGLYN